ncbi:helix-turn-helix transcriptional regulator [Rhizobium leguminosarum]|uniref:Helix-turn-helix domain-containing protein n=1 Tax=Rhizobium leguminosarum TaxID=384 RepID=A0A7K3VUC9_RHILE|nr:helix-turn-helix transcriptional regulator [Rhizobium leguminosarum]NEK19761.1 helix-turn-helix domain-containing protein [Rhizobium leguminosarum]
MDTNALKIDPKVLGFWIKCIRNTLNWSQEAVAEQSGLTVRTIQRIEAGEPSSISTRRSLARGLGYDDHGVFDSPEFMATVYKFLADIQGTSPEAMEKQFPDHMRLPAERITGGDALGRLAEMSDGLVLHMEDELNQDAKEIAASLFDYLRDVADISEEASFTHKLSYNVEMGTMLADLEAKGAVAYSAIRRTQMVGSNWPNKTPIPLTAVYVTVVPTGREFKEVMVPRRLA